MYVSMEMSSSVLVLDVVRRPLPPILHTACLRSVSGGMLCRDAPYDSMIQ